MGNDGAITKYFPNEDIQFLARISSSDVHLIAIFAKGIAEDILLLKAVQLWLEDAPGYHRAPIMLVGHKDWWRRVAQLMDACATLYGIQQPDMSYVIADSLDDADLPSYAPRHAASAF